MAETKKTAKTASVVKSIDKLRADLAAKRQELLDSCRSHKAGELVNPRPLPNSQRNRASTHRDSCARVSSRTGE